MPYAGHVGFDMELVRIHRERAVDAVYNSLRQAILGSLLKPGERLNVDALAAKLGVSLTPVRHAIQQLWTEGLVDIKPRSGTFVTSLSVRDVQETFDIRCALECLAAEKAVALISPEQLLRLRELLRLLRKPVRDESERHNHELFNWELHTLLIQASDNQRLLEMYKALNAHLRIARIHQQEADWPQRLAEEQAEHERIVAALERRSVGDLVKALRQHIFRARDALVAGMRHHLGAAR
jgi:DNA-binding GntR family transcriptional regulator